MLAGPTLAVASAAAFTLSELADLLVYQPLRRRGFLRAVLASNTVGAPLDTIVFLTLGGFPVWSALPGQLWVKAWATLTRAEPMLPRIRATGYPAALVAQDGLEHHPVPWDLTDALFLGGTTADPSPRASRLSRRRDVRLGVS